MDFTFQIRVQPGASKNEVIHAPEGAKLRLQAPAVEGKANKACVQFLSKTLKIPKRRIVITRGEHARIKTIRVSDVDEEEVARIKKALLLATD